MSEKQIFISHSSKDEDLIKIIQTAFINSDIAPFFAKRVMTGEHPIKKIVGAIERSIGLFALITPNVVNETRTRDWVIFELGVAEAKNIPLFIWRDNNVKRTFPKLIENLTDYSEFNLQNNDSCCEVAKQINEKASQLLKTPNTQSPIPPVIDDIQKITETDNSNFSQRKDSLLIDKNDFSNLHIKDSLLDKIYKKSKQLAINKFNDAKLTGFAIDVIPFSKIIFNVNIRMSFYSKICEKTIDYIYNDLDYKVKFEREWHVSKKVRMEIFDLLPWKESTNWRVFLKIALGKIGSISPHDGTFYNVYVHPSKKENKIGMDWGFSLTDRSAGKNYAYLYNGKDLDNITSLED